MNIQVGDILLYVSDEHFICGVVLEYDKDSGLYKNKFADDVMEYETPLHTQTLKNKFTFFIKKQ